jgi:hypothetical protein
MYTAADWRQFCATTERVSDEHLPLPRSHRRLKNSHQRELITFTHMQLAVVHIPEIYTM